MGSGELQLTASFTVEIHGENGPAIGALSSGAVSRRPLSGGASAVAIERPGSRQFTAESATEAAVTTKAIPRPIASRKSETTYFFFMARPFQVSCRFNCPGRRQRSWRSPRKQPPNPWPAEKGKYHI